VKGGIGNSLLVTVDLLVVDLVGLFDLDLEDLLDGMESVAGISVMSSESCESSKVIVFTLSSLLNNADSSLLGLGAILVGVRTGFLDRITLLPPTPF